jgi:hypothetical protein
MKHVLTSAGLIALGAATLHAEDPELTRQRTGRPFTMAATVRAIYDDNIATAPDGSKQDSFGISVSPSVHLTLPLDQTFVSLGYIYSLVWYADREPDSNDQSHEFNAKLRHRFSPHHNINVDESFVATSEPTIAERGGIITSPQRTESDVLHNRGAIDHNIGISRTMSLSFGYVNNWYDYEQEGAGSRSALLDRIEHLFRIDLRKTITPNLVGLVGYTFGLNNYTGDEFILDNVTGGAALRELNGEGEFALVGPATGARRISLLRSLSLKSNVRDSYSHYGYVGADYDLTARLRSSLRVGLQYSDFHEVGETDLSPYVDANVTYVYMIGSSAEVGVRHARNATDVAGSVDSAGNPTLDAETTAVYLQVVQQITPKLTGIAMAQYQTSTFNGGANDGRNEDLWLLGLNVEYRFDNHWSAEAGYNYDFLDGSVRGVVGSSRQYDRNRVYIGVRATY